MEDDFSMLLADRLRAIREAKKLSQGDIEERSGLKRSYVSRVENSCTVPSVETLEKLARALEVPLYQFFYEGEEPPKLSHLPRRVKAEEAGFGRSKKEIHFLSKLSKLLARMAESRRQLLLHMAQKMARRWLLRLMLCEDSLPFASAYYELPTDNFSFWLYSDSY